MYVYQKYVQQEYVYQEYVYQEYRYQEYQIETIIYLYDRTWDNSLNRLQQRKGRKYDFQQR